MFTHARRFEVVEPSDASDRLPSDIAYETLLMVNVVYVGGPGSGDWVLVDAGIAGFSGHILRTAKERFGDTPPRAILLTHGHADHVGSLRPLLKAWPDVSLYAHRLELPYLTGRDKYPPPDPTVGGGIMPRTAVLFPRVYDFSGRIQALPENGSVPGLDGWRWIHTPGHAPGHVSFYRDSDGTLIAGDAFVTQVQESLSGVLTRKQVMHGPPQYFTPDFDSARVSVQKLADLHPQLAITGHGLPMANPTLDASLQDLARDFDEVAIPPKGRYVNEPAVMDENGVVSLPPKPFDPVPAIAAVAGMVAVGVGVSMWINRSQREPDVESVHDWIERKLHPSQAMKYAKRWFA